MEETGQAPLFKYSATALANAAQSTPELSSLLQAKVAPRLRTQASADQSRHTLCSCDNQPLMILYRKNTG